MIIYGAGMSGLLAARMLAKHKPIVYEAAPALPNNHAALLRFRSDVVSKATGIPFKKVFVQKCVMEDGNLTRTPSILAQNMYAHKVSGKVAGRSIMNLEPGERFIAPEDFIAQLATGVDVHYNKKLAELPSDKTIPCISTIPMPNLMEMAGWQEGKDFKFNQITTITTITADIICPDFDIYQTIYFPDKSYSAYRVSITGKKLIIECLPEHLAENESSDEDLANEYMAMFFFGDFLLENIQRKTQHYRKLVSSDQAARKEFILAMTDLYNIYSLGRFATWRQILMDDVVRDIKIVESMIENRDAYSRRLHIV